ncbi:MAG TPA: hypothetical protein VGB20_01075 [bacterium]
MNTGRDVAGRTALWIVVGCLAVGIVLGWSWGRKDTAQSQPAAEESAPAAPGGSEAVPGERNVVHQFENDEEIQGFASIWQQRQGTMARMAVLRAYWSEEQARLAELNEQLSSTYGLDLEKRHVLDTQARTLFEVEEAPEQEPSLEPSS